MFGFSFNDRVKKIVRQDFDYELSAGIAHVFSDVCSQAKQSGANEHAAAIMVMIVAMNSLSVDDDPAFNVRITDFISEKSKMILQMAHLANQPKEDIEEMLFGVLEKHGLEKKFEGQLSSSADSDSPPSKSDLVQQVKVAGDSFIEGLLVMTDQLAGAASKDFLSEDQRKFVFFLQLWGAIDFVLQNQGSEDEQIFFASLVAFGKSHPFFGWSEKEIGSVISLAIDSQEHEWANRIVMNGGQAFQKLLRKDDDLLYTAEIWEDLELLRQVGSVAPDSFP